MPRQPGPGLASLPAGDAIESRARRLVIASRRVPPRLAILRATRSPTVCPIRPVGRRSPSRSFFAVGLPALTTRRSVYGLDCLDRGPQPQGWPDSGDPHRMQSPTVPASPPNSVATALHPSVARALLCSRSESALRAGTDRRPVRNSDRPGRRHLMTTRLSAAALARSALALAEERRSPPPPRHAQQDSDREQFALTSRGS